MGVPQTELASQLSGAHSRAVPLSVRVSLGLIAVFALIFAPTAGFSASQKREGAVGKIAFAVQHGDGDSPRDIYVVRTDGRWMLRERTRLDETNPAWSPDGRHIAFDARRGPNPGPPSVYMMNPDGTQRRRLAPGWGPQWSPDGRRIAYLAGAPYAADIYVMNANGKAKKRLTDNRRDDDTPRWSPNGKQIGFTRESASTTYDVYIVSASGGHERRVSRKGDSLVEAWAPGRKLIFSRSSVGSDAGPAAGIYIVNADGSDLQRVKPMKETDEFRVGGWSPDVQLIVYGDLRGIYTVRPRDGLVRRLMRGQSLTDPSWAPDGLRVAVARSLWTPRRANGIWIVNRDGSGARRIAAATGVDDYYAPTWAPR
jgi:Tol biopolymer transport system component